MILEDRKYIHHTKCCFRKFPILKFLKFLTFVLCTRYFYLIFKICFTFSYNTCLEIPMNFKLFKSLIPALTVPLTMPFFIECITFFRQCTITSFHRLCITVGGRWVEEELGFISELYYPHSVNYIFHLTF